MKLKKLTMKAFGSYGRETTIDFEGLDSGLYLIRGDTGSGKTTIFDAIVCALYGVASGCARKPAMLHSDVEPKSVDTRVELWFEHGGAKCHVERKLHFTKNRKTGLLQETPTLDATLWEDGRAPVENTTNVTERITKLLGLDAAQFGQIVMLAQGEFRRFLESDSAERGKILAKIFETSTEKYRALQDRLDRAAELLRREREECAESARHAIEAMTLPDGLGPEEARRLKPLDDKGRVVRSPTVVEDLEALLERERGRAAEAKKEYERLDGALREIGGRKATAEFRNGRLNALDKAREKRAGLEGRKEEMLEREATLERARRATAVQPAATRAADAEQRRLTAEDDLRKANDALVGAENEVRDAGEASKALDGDRARIRTLGAEIANLAASMPRYDELETAEGSLTDRRQKAKTAETAETAAKNESARAAEAIAEIDEELAGLGDTGEALATARTGAEKAAGNRKSFQDVCKAVANAKRLETDLATKRAELEERGEAMRKRRDDWSAKFDAFVRGQAGLMAERLRADIAESGSGRCPVCGTVHASVGDGFATKDEGTPSGTDVDAAKSAYDEAEKRRGAKQTEVERLEESIRGTKDGAVRAARAIPGCEDATWEGLADDDRRAERETAFADACTQADEAESSAESRNKRRQLLEEGRRTEAAKKTAADDRAREEAERKAAAEKEAAVFRATIDGLRRQLAHATKKNAENALEAKRSELETKRKAVEDADGRVRRAGEDLAARQATREEKRGDLEAARKELEESAKAFRDALAEQGYADGEAYRADAAPLPKANVRRWMDDLAKECTAYAKDVESNAEEIEGLEKETKDFRRENVEALEEERKETEERRNAANERAGTLNGLVAEHERVLGAIRTADERLAATAGGMESLDELALMATGERGGGADRVDFVRFMLGDNLREVLEQANVRLDRMTGGRFELVHRAEGRNKQGAAGLDIDVLDRTTDARRPAASFSGGEGFEASMSLALGLADVVRNHAGDVQLDSTFIDEGFGALDDDRLELCMRVLKDLAGDSRQVGIVSHVAKLEENVWPQIVVESGDRGSTVRIDRR